MKNFFIGLLITAIFVLLGVGSIYIIESTPTPETPVISTCQPMTIEMKTEIARIECEKIKAHTAMIEAQNRELDKLIEKYSVK